MKASPIFLILALISVTVYSGTLVFSHTDSTPNLVETSQGLSINTWVEKPTVFQYGVINVPK